MPGSVAAHVAAFDRRLGLLAGPLGPVTVGSGEQPNGSPLQVELFVDGVWVDITSYVMTRDGSGKVSISRGRPDENSRVNAGQCSFQLNNRDGRFSPRNPVSPYYGFLGRNQPIRVSVQSGDDKSYRFWGEVPSWPQNWDTTGTDIWVDVEAAGILRRLGQGSAPLQSVMYRALTSASVTTLPVAYWPFEDKSGSATLASGVGGPAMTIAGSPTLSSSSVFVASDSLPVMTTGSGMSGVVPSYAPTGAAQVRFLCKIPAAGTTNNEIICRFATSGTAKLWDLVYNTGGNLALNVYGDLGAVLLSTGPIAFGVDGQALRMSVELTQNGADISYRIATLAPGASSVTSSSGTVSGRTFGSVLTVTMSADGLMADTVFGHVSVQSAVTSLSDLGSQLAAFVGETAEARISRLCTEQGIAVTTASGDGGSVAMGPQRILKFLDLIYECVDADMGTLYERVDALGLGYRSRTLAYNQSVTAALSYPANNLSEVPVPVDDDQYTRNDITVSRVNGSFSHQFLPTGALSVLAPPSGVGPYDTSISVNVQSDATLPDQANWRLHVGTVDEPRYPRISVNLAHSSFVTNPGLRIQVLALAPGLRLTVSGMPVQVPPGDVSQLVAGITETIDHFQHRLTFTCVPESPYEVAVLDDPVLGRADTDGSQLQLDATASDTTLTVVTTSGPAWITTASNPGDFPFDARIAGEVVRVTGIVAVTGAQQFAVTRSINGVSKALPAGSDVRLAQPMILAL